MQRHRQLGCLCSHNVFAILLQLQVDDIPQVMEQQQQQQQGQEQQQEQQQQQQEVGGAVNALPATAATAYTKKDGVEGARLSTAAVNGWFV